MRDAISEFTPSCRDVEKRQRCIEVFFMHFIMQIWEQHSEQEREQIFRLEVNFDAILCLTTNIINFAYNSLHSCFREYCHIFGVTLLQGHKTIHWFGLKANMPKNI